MTYARHRVHENSVRGTSTAITDAMTHEIVQQPLYPIRAVSRMTGLSLDTLRAWERRYEAVVPARNDRGRVYSEADVARLKRLDELVKHGHAIGTTAASSDAELDQ